MTDNSNQNNDRFSKNGKFTTKTHSQTTKTLTQSSQVNLSQNIICNRTVNQDVYRKFFNQKLEIELLDVKTSLDFQQESSDYHKLKFKTRKYKNRLKQHRQMMQNQVKKLSQNIEKLEKNSYNLDSSLEGISRSTTTEIMPVSTQTQTQIRVTFQDKDYSQPDVSENRVPSSNFSSSMQTIFQKFEQGQNLSSPEIYTLILLIVAGCLFIFIIFIVYKIYKKLKNIRNLNLSIENLCKTSGDEKTDSTTMSKRDEQILVKEKETNGDGL